MSNRIIWGILVILTCLGTYIGVASLAQLQAYDTMLVGYASRINALQEQVYRLQEEDRELNARLDLSAKRLTELQEENRIQEVLINEARAKRKK
jgi:predicted  nucleic acid-binding Zn-ribbon protein